MIKMIRMIVPMPMISLLSVMPEQRQQNDDRQRDTQQPEQCASSKSHDAPPSSDARKTRDEDKGSAPGRGLGAIAGDSFYSCGSCGPSSGGQRCSRRMMPMISIGEARNAPIGPQSQVQNAKAKNTASALSDRPRPMIDGVTKCPSRNTTPENSTGASKAPPRVGADRIPVMASTTSTSAGPMTGM